LLIERDPQEDVQLVSNFLAYRNKKDLEIIDLDEGEKTTSVEYKQLSKRAVIRDGEFD
jgi:hypothetical protein